jgi:sugar/nucleoside kinase (ribokinase family)
VCAFIPNGYANNTAAHYQGFTGSNATAAFIASLDQADLTSWSYVGVLAADSTGTVHVTLDDTGPTGTYTAADAMRLSTSSC